jgi:hypothetical protein
MPPDRLTPAVNIALATHGFASPGGSESYVLTVAEQLERLGHGVVIYAVETGAMSEFATERRLAVVSEPDELDGRCDAIIVQDSVVAYRLAEHYPHTPQLFRAASDLYDLQLPPALPGLVGGVVVCSERVWARIAALAAGHRVHRLRQPIDTERFVPAGALADSPRIALLLGNYLRGDRLTAITSALEAHGLEVRSAGRRGQPTCSPERAIWDADIVVAKGRAALEGMACGKAVFVYDQFGGDGWVTTDSYAAMEADNFAGVSGPPIATSTQLAAELDGYSTTMGTINRELALSHHGARAHAHELCALLDGLDAPADLRQAPLLELSRLAGVQWRTELRALSLEEASRAAHGEAQRANVERDALRSEHARLVADNRELADELDRMRALCATRRVRTGLGLGALADAARRRIGRR